MTPIPTTFAVGNHSLRNPFIRIALLLFALALGAACAEAQIQASVPSLTAFIQTDATPCPPQTYVVSGTNISADVVITAPTGFEISNNGSTWVAPPASITIGQNGPTTIPTTTIYVRLNTASYGTNSGNILHTSTDSPNLNLPVDGIRSVKSPTTTGLLSSLNPSVYGQSVTLTASVSSPLPGTPTGTVTFYDGVTSLGSASLNGSAVATLSTSLIDFGSRSLTAVYGSDANFDGSTSSILTQGVLGTTTTALASNNNPSINGQSVTFTATVSSTFVGTPAGSVTFFDGVTSLGSGTLVGGSAQLATSGLAPGSHSITGVYGGDASFNTSTSSVLSQMVKAATTTGLASNHNPSLSGQPVTLTATVSSATPGVIDGNVTFYDAGIPVGTPVTLSGGTATYTAGYPASTSPHSFTATFNGDVNYAGSTSSVVNQLINKAATLPAISADHNPSYIGQSVTFTATVNPVSPAGGTPTGSVTFSIDGVPTGPISLAGGIASYSTSALSFGGHVIDASYGGDADYNPGVSAAYPDTVGPKIAATAGPHGSISPPGDVGVAYGSSPVFTMIPDPGYRVDSIYVDGVPQPVAASYTFVNVIVNHTIHATFAVAQFTITATAGPNGGIDPSGAVIVTFDSSKIFSFTPATGYHVDSIIVDGTYAGDSLSYTFTHVASAHTIHVSFAINMYTLWTSVAGGGTVTKNPNQADYSHGTSVDLTADPATGWIFDSWSGGATGTANPVTVVMDANKNVTATFVTDPAYEKRYRTFASDLLALDQDLKGKLNKPVPKKPDKVDVKLRFVAPANATGFTLKLSMLFTGMVFHDTARSTPIGLLNGIKEKVVTQAIVMGDTFQLEGYGAKGKAITTKIVWATSPKATTVNFKLPTDYLLNQPKLPMPNRVNALMETFTLGGFAADGGLLVGRNRSVPVDSSKYYGWLLSAKYTEVLKTLVVGKTRQLQTGDPAGLEKYIDGKSLVKRQKYLAPSKYSNRLLAGMVALKFNIAASMAGIVPVGFGELVYDDGGDNGLNGKMVKEITAYGDSLMSGTYTPAGRIFADTATFNRLWETVVKLNIAFEGPIDTVSWGDSLEFTGTNRLIDVPYLRTNPGVAPVTITPGLYAVDAQLPDEYSLLQNYPNPFNPSTTISYSLPASGYVTLRVYNTLGEEVATLLDNAAADEGEGEVEFNARNLSSGVYFYLLTVNPINENGDVSGTPLILVRKMVLMK